MITYRDLDYDKDVDGVINLIKKNLDPNYSKDFFLWKHYRNPFGKSISMVAMEHERIVAVVFYMRYNFQNIRGESIRTIRPLDVCTDKEQRGKGLFKVLLKECLKKNTDYDMLFSTPNKKSFPEFIKLGWSPLVKFKFCIGLIIPFKGTEALRVENYWPNSFNSKNLNTHEYFSTGTSEKFLAWRYQDTEYFIKKILKNNQEGFIIYRIGKIKGVKCLILCDYTGHHNLLYEGIKKICKIEKLYLIYYLNNSLNRKIDFFFTFPLAPATIIYKESKFVLNEDLLVSLADLEGRL